LLQGEANTFPKRKKLEAFMRAKIRSILPLVFSALLVLSCSIFTFGIASPAQTLNLPATGDVVVSDDEQPEVTDRVARISYLKGNAKIRRSGATNWEHVTLNLPLVEGDEIATDKNTRLEIQFNNYSYVRLDENSYLKVTTLRDEGIALSVSLGTMNARLTKFDKDSAFFEIDAPKTTIAIQKSGTYRVDAGQVSGTEIRVNALNGGEARIYSDNSGFTLKNGRSTRIFIDGANVGEWETGDAIRFQDEFDEWTLDRDDRIAQRIRDAYYDRYYDNDIYGADDLNAHGDWVYLRNYGYVWRPSRSSISYYSDWSPYRYGQWRWMPPYGWIWVNDEPWGWATYHHGRWFYQAGYWYWSPYGYYRPRRSWWYPALVVINIISSDVYWYPASYYYSHRDCRWRYYRPHHNNNNWGGNNGPIRMPTPVPTSPPRPDAPIPGGVRGALVPPLSVVSTRFENFGTSTVRGLTPPMTVANSVLSIKTNKSDLPQLPVGSTIKTRMSPDIIATVPPFETKQSQIKIGAGVRSTSAPLDNELRNTKMFGGRPVKEPEPSGTVNNTPSTKSETRDTGVVVRTPAVKSNNSPPVNSPPIYQPPPDTKPMRSDPPPKRDDPPVKQPPVYTPPPKRDDPPTPRYDPPKPRYDPPAPPPPPRNDPPPKRNDPPPPKRDDPPPSKKPDGRRR
jgi:hypothetical protein